MSRDLKHFPIARQARFEVPDESPRADVVELFCMPEITIGHLCNESAAIGLDDEIVGSFQETAVVILGKRPGNRVRNFEVECYAEIRIEVPLNIELCAVSNRKINFTQRHFLQKVCDFVVRILGPRQFRISHTQGAHHVGVAAARHHFDGTTDNLLDGTWLAGTELVNEMHVDRVVGMPEVEVLEPRLGH